MWRHKLNNWEEVSHDVYKFCFEQSEKRLKDVLEDAEKITSRTYTLIGILIPLLSLSVGIVVKAIIEKNSFHFVELVSLICVIVLGICLYFLTNLIRVRNIWYSGTEPQDILLTQFVERENLTGEETVKYMYLSEMESIQYKIDQNKIVNEARIGTFSKCLAAVIFAVIGTLTSILILIII